jgi:hypothetical protein
MTESPRFNKATYNKATKPPIEKLPFLGTTWYKRGASYWLRRVLGCFLMSLMLGGATVMTAGRIGAIVESRVAMIIKVIALGIVACAIALSTFRAFKAFFRAERNRKLGRLLRPNFDSERAAEQSRRYGTVGAILAATARAGSLVSGALLGLSVIFCFGWFIVIFLSTFQKEFGVEHDARLRLQRRQRRQTTKSNTNPGEHA